MTSSVLFDVAISASGLTLNGSATPIPGSIYRTVILGNTSGSVIFNATAGDVLRLINVGLGVALPLPILGEELASLEVIRIA